MMLYDAINDAINEMLKSRLNREIYYYRASEYNNSGE